MMDMTLFYTYFGLALEIAAYVVMAANVVTVVTPTRWDDKILDTVSKIVNFLAMNFGKNRNADDWPL